MNGVGDQQIIEAMACNYQAGIVRIFAFHVTGAWFRAKLVKCRNRRRLETSAGLIYGRDINELKVFVNSTV